jgi:hypothetical protein
MKKSLLELVRHRAGNCCEYCGVPETLFELRHVPDHIIALQHKGATREENLALACPFCNANKGPNIAGIDPKSRRMTALFNPRKHHWTAHFKWDGLRIVGRTAIGRATIVVLKMNDGVQLELRRIHFDEGIWRPK